MSGKGHVCLLTPQEEKALGRIVRTAVARIEKRKRTTMAWRCLTTAGRSRACAKALRGVARRAYYRLAAANQPLIWSIAKNFSVPGMRRDEIVQEGQIGLLEAAIRFDERRGIRFATYATWWIRSAIFGAIYDRSRVVRLPRKIAQKCQGLFAAERALAAETGTAPTDEEIASRLGWKAETVEQLRGLAALHVSLDEPVGRRGTATRPRLSQTADDGLMAPDERTERGEVIGRVRDALKRLPERQRLILLDRFGFGDGEEWTLADIGREIGISRERARQLEQQAFERLREALGDFEA
jgi:RNA polymerase primary sigma factor